MENIGIVFLWVAGLVYLAMAGLLALAARALMSSRWSKMVAPMAVVLAAAALPFALRQKLVSDTDSEVRGRQDQLVSICSHNKMVVAAQPVRSKSAFIDNRALKMLASPNDDQFRLIDVGRYLVARRFESLETQNASTSTGRLIPEESRKDAVVRVFISTNTDERCRAFDKHIEDRSSPAAVRAIDTDLPAGSCVALEVHDAASAPVRMVMNEQKGLVYPGRASVLRRYDIHVVKVSGDVSSPLASMTEHYSYDMNGSTAFRFRFPCGDGTNSRVVQFAQSLIGTENQR